MVLYIYYQEVCTILTILVILSTVFWRFSFLGTILAASVDVSTYNEIYFCKLFLAADFSRKFEKPSDKVPTVHFLLCDDIVHFATYLLSKIVEYCTVFM